MRRVQQSWSIQEFGTRHVVLSLTTVIILEMALQVKVLHHILLYISDDMWNRLSEMPDLRAAQTAGLLAVLPSESSVLANDDEKLGIYRNRSSSGCNQVKTGLWFLRYGHWSTYLYVMGAAMQWPPGVRTWPTWRCLRVRINDVRCYLSLMTCS